MNTMENTKKVYNKVKPLSYERIEEPQDDRVSEIYERYHAGKAIILDDLRYLWLKDPEGCKKLTKSIIESKSEQSKSEKTVKKQEVDHVKITGIISKNPEDLSNQHNYIDAIVGFDAPAKPLKPQRNIQEIINSMKIVLENMSDSDLKEMWKHINEELVSEKIGDKMKYWNHTYEDKIMMYSYEQEKKFNMLA